MKKYIGGYSILDLTDANVSAQANACYNQDKPVLVYGANGERYFADTITKSGTSIIITKGGKTITIANDNTITNVGDIQNHLYRYDLDFEFTYDGQYVNRFFIQVYVNKNLNKNDLLTYMTDHNGFFIASGLINFNGTEFSSCAINSFLINDDDLTLVIYLNSQSDTEYTITLNDLFIEKLQLF